jgi:hypothetical protein
MSKYKREPLWAAEFIRRAAEITRKANARITRWQRFTNWLKETF